MITLRKEEMAHIRKLRRKWQAIVRRGKIVVAKSFWKKSEASQWAYKIESQIETGSYFFIFFKGFRPINLPFFHSVIYFFLFEESK